MKWFCLMSTLLISIACQSSHQGSLLPDTQLAPSQIIENALRETQILSVYLTWNTDETSTTMSINYISQHKGSSPQVSYGLTKKNHTSFEALTIKEIPNTPLFVHTTTLKGLTPDTAYYFKLNDKINGNSKELMFHTLPSDDTPIEFIQGGDMTAHKDVAHIANAAMTRDTRAILIGGDLAYANGMTSSYRRWVDWFQRMNTATVSPSGYLLPMIVALGNHETNFKSSTKPFKKAPFYFQLFSQNNLKTHFTRHLGGHSVLYILDSGHIETHKSQAKWLKTEMKSSKNITNKLSMYHVPLYPTHRPYKGSLSKSGRTHWLPIFDNYELTLSFENHDHVLKRTKPLKNGKVVSNGGTIFVGDGCWGAPTRSVKPQWYHDIALREKHVWRVVASSTGLELKAIGNTGQILDSFIISN